MNVTRRFAVRARQGFVMSVVTKHALALVLAVCLSDAVALSQSPPPQTAASPSRTPAVIRDWANRLRATDPKVRATA